MKLVEMKTDMRIKHSVSSTSYKVWENFFCKKVLHGGTNVFGQIYGRVGGLFYMQTNDQIMQRGKLIVKRFQRPS